MAALAAFVLLALAPAAMAAPTADFDVDPDPPIAGTAAQFTSTSTADPGREIAQVQWDFQNDGTWDATANGAGVSDPVSHTYPSAGTWSVRMRVEDDAPILPRATSSFAWCRSPHRT